MVGASYAREIEGRDGPNAIQTRQFDCETSQVPALVEECSKQFDSILLMCNSTDSVKEDISSILTDRSKLLLGNIQAKVEHGKKLNSDVEKRILNESTLLRNESDTAAVLREKKNALQHQAVWINDQMEATKAEVHKMSTESIRWKGMADAEQENTEYTRKQGVKQAQRLQQQLSLYASTTGIKWHYLEEEKLLESGQGSFLVGEVNLPSESTIHRFQIDRENNSRYDIANQLWNMMDGSGYESMP